MSNAENSDGKNEAPRNFATRRFGGGDTSSHGSKSNPFNAMSPLTPATAASPGAGASSAFGLGSGAFASFGSANKTPKTPGTAFDWGKAAANAATTPKPTDKPAKTPGAVSASTPRTGAPPPVPSELKGHAPVSKSFKEPWPLKDAWVIWYRPPTSKNSDYEKSIKPMCRMDTAQDFWNIYLHLKRPADLPTVSDYHFFKEGIRPVWEDDMNKRGGKWIMRLKKGVANRYWEDLLLAMVGDQFFEAGEEVCGAVLSVRSGEDVFSIWTKNDGGRNIKIR
jgi:translation initiation factor 4E